MVGLSIIACYRLIRTVMWQLVVLLLIIFAPSVFAIDLFETECKQVFDSPARWNLGKPTHRQWQEYCWEYVKKEGDKFTWIGSIETRRKKEKERRIQERQKSEEKRIKQEAYKKQIAQEMERKKAEEADKARRNKENIYKPEVPRHSNKIHPDSHFFSMGFIFLVLLSGVLFLFFVVKVKNIYKEKKIAQKKREAQELERQKVQQEAEELERQRKKAEQLAKELELQKRKDEQLVVVYDELTVDQYFSFQMMKEWLRINKDTLTAIDNAFLKLTSEPEKARVCSKASKNPDQYRVRRNQKWEGKELADYKQLFDSLEKNPLTIDQRKAILRNDNHVLAVAGAGTGKTSTIIGKVAYLLERQWCSAGEILLLSYSNAAVEELRQRVEKQCGQTVKAETFHALGKEIIEQVTPSQTKVPGDVANLRPRIQKYLLELMRDDMENKDLIDFLVYHFYPPKYETEFKSKSDALSYADSLDLKTLRGEKVKSFQEVQIANWLHVNQIDYEYEKNYPGRDRYHPDFYLTDHEIYIEHFGISRDRSTRKDVPNKKYLEGMERARARHKENRTTLIETYSYEFWENNIFDELEKKLKKEGITVNRMTPAEIKKIDSIQEYLKLFSKLIANFLNLFKSDRFDLLELKKRSQKSQIDYRKLIFLEIFTFVLQRYEDDLKRHQENDFGDMILKAVDCVNDGNYQNPYKVIIVDEYQDIARGRALLIEAFVNQKPDTRLLYVGDDWQSIYRFTGSDVGLMTNYEKKWEGAIRIDLDETFRFNNKILDVSSSFIMKNPNQLKKTITTKSSTNIPAIHITHDNVTDILKSIKEDPTSSALVLGRTRYNEGVGDRYSEPGIRGMTVHKSKGLEADYVIVSEMCSGKHGFPIGIEDDPIISMLLTESGEFPNDEERRLFYVAMTRARKEVWLQVPDSSAPSEFIIELLKDKAYKGLVDFQNLKLQLHFKCPVCKSLMQIKDNKVKNGKFLGCIHYPRCSGTRPGCPNCNSGVLQRTADEGSCSNELCHYIPEVCPRPDCKEGILVLIPGRYSNFMGCSSYPECNHTQPLN